MLLDNSKSNSGREKTSVVTGNATDLQPQKKKKKRLKKWNDVQVHGNKI